MSANTAPRDEISEDIRGRYLLRDLLTNQSEATSNPSTGIAIGTAGPARPDWMEKLSAAGFVIALGTSIVSSTDSRIGTERLLASRLAESHTQQGSDQELLRDTLVRTYIRRSIDAVLSQDELFNDGIDSNLAIALRVLFRNHPRQTFSQIEELIKGRHLSDEVTAEIVKSLARIVDAATHDSRFFLICEQLEHPSPMVRDAAGIALYLLEDTRAIRYLRSAIDREPIVALRSDLQEILKQLSTASQ